VIIFVKFILKAPC